MTEVKLVNENERGAYNMGKNNTSEFIYANLVKSFVEPNKLSGFLILLKKIREKVNLQKLEETPENLFQIMMGISYELGLESFVLDWTIYTI